MAKKILRFIELEGAAHVVSVDPKTARLRKKTICGMAVPDRPLRRAPSVPDCVKCRTALDG